MDNRKKRKTSGESTASYSSETASCRPSCTCIPETPAAFSSSQVVRSATPSTSYSFYTFSPSLPRIGDYSQSPTDFMDNMKKRKTSGESTASDNSETASCRPSYTCIPETPAAFSSSQLVRSVTPSTSYSLYTSSPSLPSVSDYSQSPAGFMDFHKSNEGCSLYNPSPRLPQSITVLNQSNSVSNSTPLMLDSGQGENSGTQESYGNPPQLSVKVPKSSDLPETYTEWNNVELPVDILVLTVEDYEFLGFFAYLENPVKKSYTKDIGFVYFGSMGNGSGTKLKVALMKCSKGSGVPGGSLTVVKDAVRVLRPKAVFLVGACSGLDHRQVKLGDVVVSSKLTTAVYKTPASRDIGNLIRHAADGWEAPLENPRTWEVRVHCDGDVLSRAEGVGDDIIQRWPSAIAVEMEGEGVFAAAHDLKTEWVVVKGIKDYADGGQLSRDEWGVFASVMAASVVANMLSVPVVFEEWPNYQALQENRHSAHLCLVKKIPRGHSQDLHSTVLGERRTNSSWVITV